MRHVSSVVQIIMKIIQKQLYLLNIVMVSKLYRFFDTVIVVGSYTYK